MVTTKNSLRDDYWEIFSLEADDIDFIYQHLLEIETPQTPDELSTVLVKERVRREVEKLEKQRSAGGDIYLPQEKHEVGQKLVFPAYGWQKGSVTGLRPGRNPDVGKFDVIQVEFQDGEEHEFASNYAEHVLNNPPDVLYEEDVLNSDYVLQMFGDDIVDAIDAGLTENEDFVKIAGRWFPIALLVDINVGQLNLAEAVLDMAGGGPLTTSEIMEQIEFEINENPKLLEFSFDYALEEDERFDEVGASGKVLWFLHRLEPEGVIETPIHLQYEYSDYDRSVLTKEMLALERELDDELSRHVYAQPSGQPVGEVEVRLIFPHLQAGTLPMSSRVRPIFPTAYEAPRVRFMLKDGDTGETYPGWVVREQRYVFGLKEWYLERGFTPGGIVKVAPSDKPGEVIISAGTRRSSRDWMRTVLVGSDGGIVFAMLRQIVEVEYDERMAIAVPDVDNLNKIWQRPARQQPPLERVVVDMVRELTKLNPQGHVHASELYAAVNLMKRCPPGPILALLASRPWFVHVGDLHFRFDDSEQS